MMEREEFDRRKTPSPPPAKAADGGGVAKYQDEEEEEKRRFSREAAERWRNLITSFDWLNKHEYLSVTSHDEDEEGGNCRAGRDKGGDGGDGSLPYDEDNEMFCSRRWSVSFLVLALAAATILSWTLAGMELTKDRSPPATSILVAPGRSDDFTFDPGLDDYVPPGQLKPEDAYPPTNGECHECKGELIHHVVVKYYNDKGWQDAMDVAVAVHIDMGREGMLAIDVTAEGLDKLKNNPHIVSIDMDHPIEAIVTPRAELEDEELGDRRSLQEMITDALTLIGADKVDAGHSPKTVCIADTGYALGHPDLPVDNVGGSNMTLDTGELPWNVDVDGHGTHMAGVICATEGNNKGIVGIGSMPVYITRALRDDGLGSLGQMMHAVTQCVDNGADIVVLSIGCRSCNTDTTKEFFHKIVHERGVMVVAAAGNQNSPDPYYPASYPAVISVAAVNSTLHRYHNSNHNPQVELTAKGVMVLSTWVNAQGRHTYAYLSGTSMAAPMVAAGAAVVWSHFPQCTNQQIRNVLAKTALDIGDPGCDEDFGFGLVQLKKAIDLLSNSTDCGGESILSDTDITCPMGNRAPNRDPSRPRCVADSPSACIDSDSHRASHFNSNKKGVTCKWLANKSAKSQSAKEEWVKMK